MALNRSLELKSSNPKPCLIPNFKHLRQVVLKKKIFLIFFTYFYDLNLGLSGVGPFCVPRPLFEQIYQKTTRQCYILKFKKSEHSGSEEENFEKVLFISMVCT